MASGRGGLELVGRNHEGYWTAQDGLVPGIHCPQLAGQLTPIRRGIEELRHARGGPDTCQMPCEIRNILAHVQEGDTWTGNVTLGLVQVAIA